MKLKQFNKATAALIGGAVATVVGAMVTIDPEVLGSVQTIATFLLVLLIPNKSG